MLNQTVNKNEYINQEDFNNENIPEFSNVTNPMLNDSNVYYQSDRRSGGDNTSSFPVMAPHGVPSPNHGWNSQFASNQNTRTTYAWFIYRFLMKILHFRDFGISMKTECCGVVLFLSLFPFFRTCVDERAILFYTYWGKNVIYYFRIEKKTKKKTVIFFES